MTTKRWLPIGITAVLDVRAERTADLGFYDSHGISHQRFHVPDIGVPSEDVLTEAVGWIARAAGRRPHRPRPLREGPRPVGDRARRVPHARGGDDFAEARQLLHAKRSLVKLEARHQLVLESWMATQRVATG